VAAKKTNVSEPLVTHRNGERWHRNRGRAEPRDAGAACARRGSGGGLGAVLAVPITVNVDGASSTWDPATAVVYDGRTSGDCGGPSASVCCGYMNFFATRAAAAAWAAASHPEITGGILGQDRALRVGTGIFGQLLSA
jgi:alkylmercury lyase-like protein